MTKRIAVIDDSNVILAVIRAGLEKVGFEVSTINDPTKIDLDSAGSADLIIVDIHMPQFFGDDIVAYIKNEISIPPPIYLYSDISENELKTKADACGADGYIAKHWGMEGLISAVHGIVGEAG